MVGAETFAPAAAEHLYEHIVCVCLYVDLENAVTSYKIAMKDLIIQKNKVHYFEVASIYLRLGRHQVPPPHPHPIPDVPNKHMYHPIALCIL